MSYFYLALAIVAEVIATNALKATEEFTKLWPSVTAIVGYSISMYLLVLALRTIPVGVAYAVWAGLGIVLIGVVAAIVYRQIPDLAAIIGMTLIISGVVVIHLFSNTVAH